MDLRSPSLVFGLVLASVVVAGAAHAADRTILGTKITVRDSGNAAGRSVVLVAKEAGTTPVAGDPTVGGAQLTVSTSGETPVTQVFDLPQGSSASGAAFWSATANGYRYSDHKGENGPVRVVTIGRSSSGKIYLNATIRGADAAIDVVPPDPGTGACAALSIVDGDRYSVLFDATSTLTNRGVKLFSARNPTTTGVCPSATTTPTLDPALFLAEGLSSAISEDTACVLSNGATTTCYRFTVAELPVLDGFGPWCPATTADTGGLWQDDGAIDGALHVVDGAYLEQLDQVKGWSIVNADGTVNVTTDAELATVATQELGNWTYAQAAASGVVDHCIQATPLSHRQTILLPKTPQPASSTQRYAELPGGSMGIALNGILYFPPEPTARIEAYHNIAPLDPQGGHTGFGYDYHYHRAFEVTGVPDAGTGIYGYMFDGYAIYGSTDPDGTTPGDLDGCRGHTTGALGYHYHTGLTFPFITTCLHGAYPTQMGHG